jgi:hypothetical protein
MRRCAEIRFVGIGVLASATLAAIIGCKHPSQIVSIVTPDLNTIQAAKEGDTLTWRTMTYNGKEFTVHFIGVGPCGPDVTKITSSKGVASCPVGKSPSTAEVYYQYYIDYNPSDQPKNPNGPRSCSGCLIEQDPTADFVAPQTSSAPSTSANPKVRSALSGPPDGKVLLSCDTSQTTVITAQGPANPTTSIYWLADPSAKGWVVTFPDSGTALCNEGSQFKDGNNTCTLSQPLSQSYNFSVKTDNCPTSQTFPVPATP